MLRLQQVASTVAVAVAAIDVVVVDVATVAVISLKAFAAVVANYCCRFW